MLHQCRGRSRKARKRVRKKESGTDDDDDDDESKRTSFVVFVMNWICVRLCCRGGEDTLCGTVLK